MQRRIRYDRLFENDYSGIIWVGTVVAYLSYCFITLSTAKVLQRRIRYDSVTENVESGC
jgi:hypothetical protein